MLKRSTLLKYFGLTWLSASLGPALSFFKQSRAIAQSKVTNEVILESNANGPSDGYTTIGTVSQLKKSGFIQKDRVSVVYDPKNSEKLLAVSSKCTHKGCTVNWSNQEKRFICPCHGAIFDANGAVVKGPAKRPLPIYAVKTVDNKILVKI
jgi:cytochrome b6-f complex iron-sulfur subunit